MRSCSPPFLLVAVSPVQAQWFPGPHPWAVRAGVWFAPYPPPVYGYAAYSWQVYAPPPVLAVPLRPSPGSFEFTDTPRPAGGRSGRPCGGS